VRTVVFGYHEIGYVCLEELIAFGAKIDCLFTHEDDPGEEVWFRRPAFLAEKHGIPVYTPDNLKGGNWAELIRGFSPDIVFSFYYRKMIPPEILEIPRIGALNLHGSLLPRFRGRCPVNWVLIHGETKTGLTLHYMLEKPDAGDIIAQKEVEITFEDTAHTLFVKMAEAARHIVRETLPLLRDGTFVKTPQTGQSSYFGGRKPEDGVIDWGKDALTIYNLVRATTHPYPGAFTFVGGRKLYIWRARPEEGSAKGRPGEVISAKPFIVSTGRGLVRLLRIQVEGEAEIDGEEFDFTGYSGLKGKILGGTN
jgi:methionyl-tRNA formyltransferase